MTAGRKVLFALAVFAAGCGGPQVTFNRRYEFSKLKRVAVSRFEGPGGSAAADFLAHSLLGSGADVVERSRLEAVLSEQRLASSGALDPATARLEGSADIRYVNNAGLTSEDPLDVLLPHFFNHQTHHRAQVHTLLSQLGQDPPVLDLHRVLRPNPA